MATGPSPRVVVTSRSFGRYVPDGIRLLEEAGLDVVMAGQGAPWPEDRMVGLARDAQALIVGTDQVTRRVLAGSPRLRVVARHGVGVDNIDLAGAAALGIAVTYTPGANTDAVAELTVALLLALWRGIVAADRTVREGRWEPVLGYEARGRTLGVVGLGRIGRGVAERARALGMRVVAFDVAEDRPYALAHGIAYLPLEDLLRTADAVSVHVPLTPKTRGLIGARELAWMKPTAVLVNVARGGVIDEEALAAALEGGRLAGAAVDVFTVEPPWESPLLRAPNVILTPHIGAHTLEAMTRMDLMAASDVVAVLRGDPPSYPVPAGGAHPPPHGEEPG
ncbi:MAG: phosphoglycerate dehydrogenase [Armatimonadota bacterium]|nr:phosphoglycerate dehydrogenase [Armatimonadota bacterium]MDR7451546.1 phosphoglycerate dehydrogenase [Armatimonadota bacterium]MDR7467513.1 phosphoglycerate dehydrogenase [Armatimonadota bacterium]MDR7494387.1 phosphoglycerate dehydrogenase [Armatimonadota bacterium]MDR7499204.1 phosphoglycerate dehydrogenase [Armatimonadota bacterium]